MWFPDIPSPPQFVFAHRDGNKCTIQWKPPFYPGGGNEIEYLVDFRSKRHGEAAWNSQYERVRSAHVTDLQLLHENLEDENNEYDFKYRVFARNHGKTLMSQPAESCGIH
jgi:Fibronectin type III domain